MKIDFGTALSWTFKDKVAQKNYFIVSLVLLAVVLLRFVVNLFWNMSEIFVEVMDEPDLIFTSYLFFVPVWLILFGLGLAITFFLYGWFIHLIRSVVTKKVVPITENLMEIFVSGLKFFVVSFALLFVALPFVLILLAPVFVSMYFLFSDNSAQTVLGVILLVAGGMFFFVVATAVSFIFSPVVYYRFAKTDSIVDTLNFGVMFSLAGRFKKEAFITSLYVMLAGLLSFVVMLVTICFSVITQSFIQTWQMTVVAHLYGQFAQHVEQSLTADDPL